MTGMVGASCVDSRDRIVTVNRGFLPNGLLGQEGDQSIPSPPVVIYDREGNVADSWGDPTLTEDGAAAVLPHGIHGCFVDYMDNVWVAGNSDGVVQKWTNDGSEMLLQIGTKGLCDGPPTLSPNAPYPTCGEPGTNTQPDAAERARLTSRWTRSRTRLPASAGRSMSPTATATTGSWSSTPRAPTCGSGARPGAVTPQFVETGGGHPHCVVLSNDGLVYACDRGQNRVQVFDREGNPVRIMSIDPPAYGEATLRATDIELSRDPEQRHMFVVDLGSNRVWILERESGDIVGSFGRSGHMAGEFTFVHTIVADSQGDVYLAETVGGRRNQKFTRVSD